MRNSNNKFSEKQLINSEWVLTQNQQKNQNEITRAVLAARQNERIKIAHEIQENLSQILIAALLFIELAKTDEESREMCLERSSSFISTVIKELATMSRTLEMRNIDLKMVD